MTHRGLQDFRTGLKLGGSSFSLLHGHSVPPRARSPSTGAYQGVGFLSSFPSRVVAQAWPPEVYRTSRVQAASFLVGDLWILGGVCYGFATDKARTGPILDSVLDRILSQLVGPRFIAGDWNLELHELPQFPLLRSRGFVDIQDLHAARSGQAVQPTCKGKTRKDFLFVSPELQAIFLEARVDPTYWADHSVVSATFALPKEHVAYFSWRRPMPRVSQAEVQVQGDFVPSSGSATERFAHVCEVYEEALSSAEQAAGRPPLSRAERGRGQVQQVRCRRSIVVPHRKGRQGDVEPLFFGQSVQHAHWFRQLRRLQALVQSLKGGRVTHPGMDHRASLWDSILKAPGFPGSFPSWWPMRETHLVGDVPALPISCPPLDVCQGIFLSFEANFRQLEKSLLGHRRAAAVARREADPVLIFRDLRLPPKAPVESLVESVTAEVVEVCADEQALELDTSVDWRPGVPFTCAGLPLHVVHHEPDKVWVTCVEGLIPGMKVEQARLIGSLLEIFAEFGSEWGKRWMRHEQVDVSAWRHVAASFQEFAPFPEMEPCVITLPIWRAALRRKSPHSAPGPDGLSRRDLLAMPDALAAEVLSLFHQAEQQGFWPQQLMTGLISSLAKTPGATQVSHYRPICLLSMCYRTWSSIRCKEALRHIKQFAPPGLLGNLPGSGAADSWYSVLLQIEAAYRQGTELCGVAVDLVKAYNMLPRLPVAAFAKMCGIPDTILVPWISMLTQLRRHFKVRGSTGPPLLSSTGFAEGDPLSCLAMAVLNIACHHNFQNVANPSQLLSFVDNWHALAHTAEDLVSAHRAITDFAQAWDLPVDSGKTVVWSTTAKGRAALRQAGFRVALDFRELGAHLASSRRGTNFSQTDRIRALDEKWPRLEASLSPFKHKVRALSTAAWPAALHAISASPLGERHFIKLRSDAMKAIGLRAPGANPMIQLSLVGHAINDPQFYALQSTFRDAKFLAGREVMAPLLTAAVCDLRKVPGPCTILLQRANEVGIAWDQASEAFVDSLGRLDVWRLSWPEVLQRLVFAWQDRVKQAFASRPTFEGLESTDPHLTTLVLGKLPAPARALVRLSLNGTFFTNNALRHAGQADQDTCDFCGRADSIRHRLLDCPYFEGCRESCHLTRTDLEALPACQLQHGWAQCPANLQVVRAALSQLPVSLRSFHPFPDLPEYHVFVDGSCLRPSVPHLRLASWAALIAEPGGFGDPFPLSDGLVPGLLQSAFRAELCAMVSALLFCAEVRRKVYIWSDCLGVVRKVRRFLEGSWVPGERTRHADLWKILIPHQETLAAFCSVCKVTAHLEPEHQLGVGDEWCAYFNNLVDRAAERAQTARDMDFWNAWTRLCQSWEQERFVAGEVIALHVRVGHLATRSRVDRTHTDLQPLPPPDWTGTLGVLSEAGAHALARRYGQSYVRDLVEWSVFLVDANAPVRWISSVQLFFSFCLRYRRPPVFRDKAWRDLDSVRNGHLVQVPTSSWVRYFLRHLRDLAGRGGGSWRLQECRPHSATLCVKLSSLPLRFNQALWDETEAFLSRNLPNQAVAGHERSWRNIPAPVMRA